MNIIDSYRFGRIVVNGKHHTSDLIVFPDKVKDNWWRRTSHQLRLDELSEVIAEKPEVLVVGTGYNGCLIVEKGTIEFLESTGIELYAAPTKEACRKYNELTETKSVVAALHLSC